MAIEGVDGCGKTTQAKMLVDRLNKNGYKATYVRPVYVLLNFIRLKEEDKNSVSPRRARVSEISNKKSIIRKALMGLLGYPYALATYIFMKFYLGRNKIIVCDRYFYQFFFDLFGTQGESAINFFPRLDITFFLDGDLDLFYSRMDNSFDVSVGRNYYAEVITLYRRISQKYGFIRIDANRNKDEINDIMFMHLKYCLKNEGCDKYEHITN